MQINKLIVENVVVCDERKSINASKVDYIYKHNAV